MRLKDIKEEYTILKMDKRYLLYSKELTGKLSPRKYLCTIKKHSGTKFFVDGFEPTSKFQVLKEQVSKKLDSYEYDSEFYNTSYREGFFEELVIKDYLYSMGFDYKGDDTFKLGDKNIYGFNSFNIELFFSGLDSFNDVYRTGKPSENVTINLYTGEFDYSWISHKCKRNVDDIKKGIDSLLKPLMVSDAANLINISDKMENFKDFDVVLKKLSSSLDVSKTDIKTQVKKRLLEIAEKL